VSGLDISCMRQRISSLSSSSNATILCIVWVRELVVIWLVEGGGVLMIGAAVHLVWLPIVWQTEVILVGIGVGRGEEWTGGWMK